MIILKHLSKSYGNSKVLHDINLEFHPGKVYGLVGANGSGKTTMFRCIAGLENHEGEVEYEHAPIKNHLGFLPTNPIILSRITAWEYVKLLSIARGIAIDNFEEQNIFELPLDQYADSYSTGMKKKLALFAILLQKNKVFILDEPFNGVDFQSNLIIVDLIKKLQSLDKTILISSHIFSTLRDTCDTIHVLQSGAIVKSVDKLQFEDLEKDMKEIIIGENRKSIHIS